MQDYKGVEHFFQRNIELFQWTYSCAKFCSRGKGVYGNRTELRKKRNPLSNHFNRLWYSLKRGLCKYVQSLLHKGVNHLILNHALIHINTKQTHYFEVEPLGVCSIFLKDTCHGCMHAVRPFIWVKRLNKIGNIILKKPSISFKENCHSEWGWTS